MSIKDALCCFSYYVAYNKDFDFNGKFYCKRAYDEKGNEVNEKWKELKIIK